MLRASISVIPKPGKDQLFCAIYRPISLLNCNVKLFDKILASRMNTLMQRLIAVDQVGFIHTREERDNTLNIIQKVKISHNPLLLLSTDTKKVFNRDQLG